MRGGSALHRGQWGPEASDSVEGAAPCSRTFPGSLGGHGWWTPARDLALHPTGHLNFLPSRRLRSSGDTVRSIPPKA